MAQRATLHVRVITATTTVFDGEADMVLAPGSEGELGILPHHAPLLTTLDIGELRVRRNNVDEGIFIGGGFLEFNDNVVTVLADDAERSANIDEERAQEARKRAAALLERRDLSEEAAAMAAAELQRAAGRIRVAEIQRRPGGHRRSQPTPQELGS
jgi:F-type H+-transporting ATPase subunit epsilon